MIKIISFKNFILLFLINSVLSGELQVENECKASGGKLHYFSITDCDKAPCTFKRNKSYTVRAIVEPSADSESERIKCGTLYFGNDVVIHDANACCGLVDGSKCPFVAGQNYTYEHTFNLPNFVPVGRYNVHCKLTDDAKTDQACGGLPMQIGTHNGRFHCDEVLACFMLKLLPTYKDAEIVRTRNNEILQTCDIVVDVGGVFDSKIFRFDHHQKSFNDTMSSLRPGKPWTTKLSSAGLVYAHFGESIIAQVLDKPKTDELVQLVFDKMYENFVEEIDAIDNGVMLNDQPMRYRVTTTLSNRVSYLNPSLRDPNPDEMIGFQKALTLVGNEFLERVHYFASDMGEASFTAVKTVFDSRHEVDASGQIIDLGNTGYPWKDHLFKLEKDNDLEDHIKFVIYKGKDDWRVRAVPVNPDSFILRIPLVKEWQGQRGKELEEISGIPNIVFVHANGFIGAALERNSVIQMARMSILASKNK